MQNIIGLIPARGGSKGVHRKNIVDVAGKPLLAYVIEAAHKAKALDGLYLTTDDHEIVDVANGLGVDIINRPSNLAADNTPVLPVIQHAVRAIERRGREVDWILLLQPTYPFIQPERIEQVISACLSTSAESVTTLVEADFKVHPFNARIINADSTVSFKFSKEKKNMPNRQSAPKSFYFGNLVATRKKIIESGSIYGEKSHAVEIEQWEALDIDAAYDLTLCKLLIEHWKGVKPSSNGNAGI